MDLDKLLIKKEEIPILHDCCFRIPIHPKFVNGTINLDSSIANGLFSDVASDWYLDLVRYRDGLEEGSTKEWISNVFLKSVPVVKRREGTQFLDDCWEDNVNVNDNGFVIGFSISRNSGGSLYFDMEDISCNEIIFFDTGRYIRFSEEKAREFAKDSSIYTNKGVKSFVYAHHNIDFYPGALFLRNWAIAYQNELFKRYF
jgi:hypothetical protein